MLLHDYQQGKCTMCGKLESRGDVNADGKINIMDAALIRRYLAGWNVIISKQEGDVNADEKIDIVDAALIRRYLAGWNITLASDTQESVLEDKQMIAGYGWWKDTNGVSIDYVLTGDGEMAFGVEVIGEYPAFCVEVTDGKSWFTTTSQGDAWFAGDANTARAEIVKGEVNSRFAVDGHIYDIIVKRNGNSWKIIYWDQTKMCYLWEELSGNSDIEFSENVNVHIMAQTGYFTVWKKR